VDIKMKRIFFLQILITICLCSYIHAESQLIDRIVAVVNNEIITFSDLQQFKTLMFSGMEKQPDTEDLNQKILAQLIEKKLILQQAAELKIKVQKEDIDKAIENILIRNKIDMEKLKVGLAQQGTTLEEYRQMMKNEIMESEVVGRQVHASITISDEDIEKYYTGNIKPSEKQGARVRLQQILLPVPENTDKETLENIEKSAISIRERTIAGEAFEKLAATYSQGPAAQAGGDLGYFHKGEMLPEIENAAFSIKPGEVSRVIKTRLGFHIIKILDHDDSEKDRSWKDHQSEIENILYNREFSKKYTEWMTGLREKSYIKIN
jgi:parvulin-like peptidyl-prolyl isomerase